MQTFTKAENRLLLTNSDVRAAKAQDNLLLCFSRASSTG